MILVCCADVGGGSVENGTRHTLARIPLRWMIRQCFLANTGIRFHSALLPKVGLDPHSLYPDVKERPPALYISSYAPGASSIPTTVVSKAAELPPSPSTDAGTPVSTLSATPLLASTSTDTTKTLVSFTEDALASGLTVDEWLQRLREQDAPLTEEEEDLADALSPIYDQLSLAKGWWSLEVVPLRQRYQTVHDKWEDKLTSVLASSFFFNSELTRKYCLCV